MDATLLAPVVVKGVEVLPVGSRVGGQVAQVIPSGKVKGRARLAVRFTTLTPPDRGDDYEIDARVAEVAPATKASDAKHIGIPAAGGAILGGLLGGKQGAAIGAVVGGGAGTATVLTTPGREVVLPRGTTLSLRLAQPLDVRLPIHREIGG